MPEYTRKSERSGEQIKCDQVEILCFKNFKTDIEFERYQLSHEDLLPRIISISPISYGDDFGVQVVYRDALEKKDKDLSF